MSTTTAIIPSLFLDTPPPSQFSPYTTSTKVHCTTQLPLNKLLRPGKLLSLWLGANAMRHMARAQQEASYFLMTSYIKYMKYKTTQFILTLICLLGITQSSWAQIKFGTLNAQALLAEHPKIQAADKELEAYYNQLVEEGKKKAAAFEQEYLAFIQQYQAGELAPAEAQKKQEAIAKKQQELQQLEAEIAQKVEALRQELYEPVLKEVQAAIEAVGKTHGYTFIFDTSTYLSVLFADSAIDVSSLVKTQLGL